MSVPNFYFNLIVYLYPSVNLAKKNEKIGGTGFLVGVESEEKGKFFVYIVTNCHILEKIKSTGSKECAIRINTKDGKTDILSTSLERALNTYNLGLSQAHIKEQGLILQRYLYL